jgi:hypothetical protein
VSRPSQKVLRALPILLHAVVFIDQHINTKEGPAQHCVSQAIPKEHFTAHINQSSRVRSTTIGDFNPRLRVRSTTTGDGDFDPRLRVRSTTIGDGDFNPCLTEEEPDCSAVKELDSAYIDGQFVRHDSVAEPNN